MEPQTTLRPLISWQGFSARVDRAQLHAWVNRELPARVAALRRLVLEGLPEGDLVLQVTFAWKGLAGTVSVRMRDAQLLHGFVGCQVVSVSGPLGLPLPASTVASILKRALPGKVQFDPGDGVFLLDLRQWLPAGLEVTVRRISCGSEYLELLLGPGSLTPRAPVLGADTS